MSSPAKKGLNKKVRKDLFSFALTVFNILTFLKVIIVVINYRVLSAEIAIRYIRYISLLTVGISYLNFYNVEIATF